MLDDHATATTPALRRPERNELDGFKGALRFSREGEQSGRIMRNSRRSSVAGRCSSSRDPDTVVANNSGWPLYLVPAADVWGGNERLGLRGYAP